MAESSKSPVNEGNDNWFGSWLNAAKNKSSEVLQFVKKDLEEFGSAVKTEATNVVSTTGAVLERTLKLDTPDSTASSMKRSFSSFLGQMNTVLNPSPDDSDTEAILIIGNSETVTLTKLQQAIYELQKNAKTFTTDPDSSLSKQYECWLEIIDDQLSSERIEKHLNSSTVLKEQYEKLVPDEVSHQLFWKRYLFKKALLEDDIARQEAMEKREQKEKMYTAENIKWEQEKFSEDIELTEEQQIRILEEYENETKNKKKATNTKKTDATVDEKSDADARSNTSSTDEDWEKISDVEK